eukprot:CAMPEP_0184679240 /NCGR_PEP_ID=MMETSP0312-20130426/2055_1 /TAXON_ID=31354 /ORGANISM="Compsopogon coeruleus, Strain SAG 36.94" /LENGTH=153 /DNA_ID=CAMNT_0027128543 /DNA_START=1237 /DNA_END=1696 /DNA_ORIENTATION=+
MRLQAARFGDVTWSYPEWDRNVGEENAHPDRLELPCVPDQPPPVSMSFFGFRTRLLSTSPFSPSYPLSILRISCPLIFFAVRNDMDVMKIYSYRPILVYLTWTDSNSQGHEIQIMESEKKFHGQPFQNSFTSMVSSRAVQRFVDAKFTAEPKK